MPVDGRDDGSEDVGRTTRLVSCYLVGVLTLVLAGTHLFVSQIDALSQPVPDRPAEFNLHTVRPPVAPPAVGTENPWHKEAKLLNEQIASADSAGLPELRQHPDPTL